MMKVNVQVLGGQIQQIEVAEGTTVREIKNRLSVPSHTAVVNGESASDDQVLSAFEFVSLAPSVKGGQI